ncbi:MAG: UDP-N-acetylmuramoyl-L-alanyl-D-glutamate--2,6-diaminopimelate ligase [Actinomycetota bacterium]
MDPSFPPVPLGAVAAAVGATVHGDADTRVREVAYDSRAVPAGSLFCCIPGEQADGHRFAAEAVRAGAVALVVEHPVGVDVPQVVVASVRRAIGPMSAVVFGSPAGSLTMAGITGTNGKTTTTYLLEAVFRASGKTPGVIGTTGAHVDARPLPLARTTPEAPDLHRLLARMRAAGCDAVAMEVSSHALAQHRVDGVVCDVAAFTNLSQDHLDYHPTMQAYFQAKARLFTPALARRGVVNVDDAWGRGLLESPSIPLATYGFDREADLRGADLRVHAGGLTFRAGGVEVSSPLRGRFNAWNCLTALAVAQALGLGLAESAEAIATVAGVPGRMEPVDAGQDFLVMVDYAHTPDSILHVLRGARPLATGRVIVVLGCGGDRDRAKRPLMGRVATSEADLTVITSDNPRSEDPFAIIEEMLPGAREGGGDFVVEPDRRAAIAEAVGTARAGDVVVIAGKGHETYQEVGGEVLPFDDRAVAREALAGRSVPR